VVDFKEVFEALQRYSHKLTNRTQKWWENIYGNQSIYRLSTRSWFRIRQFVILIYLWN